MTLPDFIIIGAPKCGTTAMRTNFNKNHPNIWLGGRENNFFNLHWAKGVDWYKSKFPSKTHANTLYGEKTPSYIYSLEQDGVTEARQLCHKRMHEVVPNAKLILCLRNPIDRAFSHWNMESNRVAAYGNSFAEAVDIDLRHMQDPNYIRFSDYDFVQKGFYIEYIENLLRYFPRQQIHICFTEELKTDVEAQYNAIYRFLDLEIPQNAQYSVSSTEYKSEMDPGMRHQLRPIFEPYNKRLFNYLGRDVQAWSN